MLAEPVSKKLPPQPIKQLGWNALKDRQKSTINNLNRPKQAKILILIQYALELKG